MMRWPFNRAAGARSQPSLLRARDRELDSVCLAIRLGMFKEAEVLLAARDGADRDSIWLNLRAVLYEAQGDWRRAKRHYGKAVRRDRNCAAAWQNLRRHYELHTFGRTTEPVALGDERPALGWLLARKHFAAND